MKNYYLIYLIFNAINVFLVYNSIHKLLYDNIRNKYLEAGAYIIYYLIISTLYICAFTPNTIIVVNISILFLLLFNYIINLKNKIILLFNLYFILHFISLLVALLLKKIDISPFVTIKYNSVMNFVVETIFYFFALKFIKALKILNVVEFIGYKLWISLLIVPIISFLVNSVFLYVSDEYLEYSLILIFGLLLINISIYIIYNFIFEALDKDMKNKILEKENILYREQFENTKKYIDVTRKLNHDFKYHLIHTKKLIENQENKNAINYIEDIFKLQEDSNKKFIDTGNYNIDNIINFKLNEAFNKSIFINVDANIPYDIKISEFHIVSILGNLIQNAIEANEKVEIDRFINLEIKYKLNKLFIIISNRFDRNIKIENNKLISTKSNKFEHGIGMENIDNFVKLYNGEMMYSYQNDIFIVEILLFI